MRRSCGWCRSSSCRGLSVDDELAELTTGERAIHRDERGRHRLANDRRTGDDITAAKRVPLVLDADRVVGVEMLERQRANRVWWPGGGCQPHVVDLRCRHD